MYTTKVCCYPHSYQGRYCSFSQILTAGAAYRWYKDTFFPLESIPSQDFNKNVYEMMESKMPDQSKNIFFIPHLSGSGNPTMNPNAKGCIYGLTLATDRYDIARAILEGITFELKINLELMESITGNNINEIKSFGGGARSDFWLQLKADITEKNIISSNTIEAGCLGAALLAGYGAGVFPSLDQGIEAVNHNLIYQKYRPNPKMHEVYSQKYTHYLLISQKINELYLQLE
ncbi:MAG: FGGY-family carbohydrate kinase [Candidatus Atribacteria bacterium]|nr:FGGY-family carbohydrate kinase [Candidatus Atribacteria bacterium]